MSKTKITKKDKEINDNLYKEYEKLKMEDGWNEGDKDINYRKLINIAHLTNSSFFNSSVLDVGCGTGDLSSYLRNRNIDEYIGIDIYKPAIERARIKYPKETFILGDILEDEIISKKYDFVFCSGALTTNLKTDNYLFLHAMIQKMWSHASTGLVFNMLTDDDKEPDPDLFFYNTGRVIEICRSIAPRAQIVIEKNPLFFQTHVYMFN